MMKGNPNSNGWSQVTKKREEREGKNKGEESN